MQKSITVKPAGLRKLEKLPVLLNGERPLPADQLFNLLPHRDTLVTDFGKSVIAHSETSIPFNTLVILEQPNSVSLFHGETLTISIRVLSNPACTYQLYKDGELVEGATSATYTKTAESTDVGEYYFVCDNGFNTVTSISAVVNVSIIPIGNIEVLGALSTDVSHILCSTAWGSNAGEYYLTEHSSGARIINNIELAWEKTYENNITFLCIADQLYACVEFVGIYKVNKNTGDLIEPALLSLSSDQYVDFCSNYNTRKCSAGYAIVYGGYADSVLYKIENGSIALVKVFDYATYSISFNGSYFSSLTNKIYIVGHYSIASYDLITDEYIIIDTDTEYVQNWLGEASDGTIFYLPFYSNASIISYNPAIGRSVIPFISNSNYRYTPIYVEKQIAGKLFIITGGLGIYTYTNVDGLATIVEPSYISYHNRVVDVDCSILTKAIYEPYTIVRIT